MFENIKNIFKKNKRKELLKSSSKDTAKERLHLVLMQDRANVSADFLDLMKQEIIDVIKKYIEIDESAIDVKLTNKENGDGTKGAPALYANIPILNIKDEARQNAKVITKDEENKKIEEKHQEKETLEKIEVEKEKIKIENSSDEKLEEDVAEDSENKDTEKAKNNSQYNKNKKSKNKNLKK